MKAVCENLYARGKRGTLYLRRKIPSDLRDAYPHSKKEIVVSLRTSDVTVAKQRLHAQMARIEDQFAQRRERLRQRWKSSDQPHQHLTAMSDQRVQELADWYVRCVLETDEERRRAGLDDDEFCELGSTLQDHRTELGRLLARGHSEPILPAMRSFLAMNNICAELAPDDEKRAGYVFLQGVVKALDYQLRRQDGEVLPTDTLAPVPPVAVTWKEVFEAWRDYVVERPKATTIACNTAWKQLEAFSQSRNIRSPAHVTPELMDDLISAMRADKLSPKTINERLRKIRAVYAIAIGRRKLQHNPAATTLGVKLPKHKQGLEKRRPFSAEDLRTIFGSPIYTQHLRSRGQSGEASYWLPLMMYYTGARPEEIAGLLVEDVRHDNTSGWYLEVTDLPGDDDAGLFEEDGEDTGSTGKRRMLKNPMSRRQIPVAKELVDLGLLRYVEHIRAQGHTRLFPTLQADTHGKLSGAHGKFFGRYKRELGITSPLKTLYSLRHNVKDLLEAAQVPSRYLKRILGHATGDGAVTDGYGTGLPLELVAGYFSKVRFPKIPALPWQPGTGVVALTAASGSIRTRNCRA